jgi:hypothetical protein
MIVAYNSKTANYITIKQITKIPNIYIFIVKEPNWKYMQRFAESDPLSLEQLYHNNTSISSSLFFIIICTDWLCAGILVPISQEFANGGSKVGESFYKQRAPVASYSCSRDNGSLSAKRRMYFQLGSFTINIYICLESLLSAVS